MVPLLRMLQSGFLRPDAHRPFRGLAFRENGRGRRIYFLFVSSHSASFALCMLLSLRNHRCGGGQAAGFFLRIMSAKASFSALIRFRQVPELPKNNIQENAQTGEVTVHVSLCIACIPVRRCAHLSPRNPWCTYSPCAQFIPGHRAVHRRAHVVPVLI